MDDIEVIRRVLTLMKKECKKYNTYSACDICPFGTLCRQSVYPLTESDIDDIVEKYVKINLTVSIGSENECMENLLDDFNIDVVLEQLEDYGKYKGILRVEKDGKCDNYIPVTVAKQIVKGRGLGGGISILGEKT